VPAVQTRRERLRAATVEEIQATARRLLVSEGPSGVTLRAIGREMGLTAPALYRYFPSLDSLLEALCGTLYEECADYIEQSLDGVPETDYGARLYATSRAFRRWSTAHPAEFAMMFGSPLAGRDEHPQEGPAYDAGVRFANVFLTQFVGLWHRAPFPIPPDDEIPPALRAQLRSFLTENAVPLPVGAMKVFVSCWIRLYGLLALEIFGHLHFGIENAEPMFEVELGVIARQLGVEPQPAPAAPPAAP
jgi:AcrR family transcriptional regulator